MLSKEEAIKQLEDLKIDRQSFLQNEENHDEIFKKDIEAIDTVLQALENSIPRQVVEEKLKEIDKNEKEELKGLKGQDRYFVKQMYQNQRKPYQELLEGK